MDPKTLAAENEELRAQLAQQKRVVSLLTQQMSRLLDEVARLTKKPRPPKNNRGKKEPASETAEGSCEPPKPPARAEEAKTAEAPTKPGPRRGPIPDHLPRVTEPQPLQNTIACCQTPLLEARDPLIREQRDFVPSTVRVKRIELHRAECLCCGTMHTADMPPVAMPNGSMTAALIAFVVHGKCGMHLPLIRIIQELASKGLLMAKATMSNAMRHAAGLMMPIYDRIVAELFKGDLLHLDGTGVKTLHPGTTGHHRGQFAVVCNSTLTAFVYSCDKSAKHLLDFFRIGLKDAYAGRIVADGANNMDGLYADGRIQECGCWYHARDKFDEAVASSPVEATEALGWIGTLFDVEAAADAQGDTAAERRARRKRDSVPLLRGFYKWMCAMQLKLKFTPDEELYKAIQYCWNQWCALTRFMTDGSIPMTNNLAERELGMIGRGRKAWLFAGSDASGGWLAVLYTVVRTCQRLSVAPFDYLAWALPKLSDLPVNRGRGHLANLTPMAFAQHRGAI